MAGAAPAQPGVTQKHLCLHSCCIPCLTVCCNTRLGTVGAVNIAVVRNCCKLTSAVVQGACQGEPGFHEQLASIFGASAQPRQAMRSSM